MKYVVMVAMISRYSEDGTDTVDFPVASYAGESAERKSTRLCEKLNEMIDESTKGESKFSKGKMAARNKLCNVITSEPGDYYKPTAAYAIMIDDEFENNIDAAFARFKATE